MLLPRASIHPVKAARSASSCLDLHRSGSRAVRWPVTPARPAPSSACVLSSRVSALKPSADGDRTASSKWSEGVTASAQSDERVLDTLAYAIIKAVEGRPRDQLAPAGQEALQAARWLAAIRGADSAATTETLLSAILAVNELSAGADSSLKAALAQAIQDAACSKPGARSEYKLGDVVHLVDKEVERCCLASPVLHTSLQASRGILMQRPVLQQYVAERLQPWWTPPEAGGPSGIELLELRLRPCSTPQPNLTQLLWLMTQAACEGGLASPALAQQVRGRLAQMPLGISPAQSLSLLVLTAILGIPLAAPASNGSGSSPSVLWKVLTPLDTSLGPELLNRRDWAPFLAALSCHLQPSTTPAGTPSTSSQSTSARGRYQSSSASAYWGYNGAMHPASSYWCYGGVLDPLDVWVAYSWGMHPGVHATADQPAGRQPTPPKATVLCESARKAWMKAALETLPLHLITEDQGKQGPMSRKSTHLKQWSDDMAPALKEGLAQMYAGVKALHQLEWPELQQRLRSGNLSLQPALAVIIYALAHADLVLGQDPVQSGMPSTHKASTEEENGVEPVQKGGAAAGLHFYQVVELLLQLWDWQQQAGSSLQSRDPLAYQMRLAFGLETSNVSDMLHKALMLAACTYVGLGKLEAVCPEQPGGSAMGVILLRKLLDVPTHDKMWVGVSDRQLLSRLAGTIAQRLDTNVNLSPTRTLASFAAAVTHSIRLSNFLATHPGSYAAFKRNVVQVLPWCNNVGHVKQVLAALINANEVQGSTAGAKRNPAANREAVKTSSSSSRVGPDIEVEGPGQDAGLKKAVLSAVLMHASIAAVGSFLPQDEAAKQRAKRQGLAGPAEVAELINLAWRLGYLHTSVQLAQQERAFLRKWVDELLQACDVLLAPLGTATPRSPAPASLRQLQGVKNTLLVPFKDALVSLEQRASQPPSQAEPQQKPKESVAAKGPAAAKAGGAPASVLPAAAPIAVSRPPSCTTGGAGHAAAAEAVASGSMSEDPWAAAAFNPATPTASTTVVIKVKGMPPPAQAAAQQLSGTVPAVGPTYTPLEFNSARVAQRDRWEELLLLTARLAQRHGLVESSGRAAALLNVLAATAAADPQLYPPKDEGEEEVARGLTLNATQRLQLTTAAHPALTTILPLDANQHFSAPACPTPSTLARVLLWAATRYHQLGIRSVSAAMCDLGTDEDKAVKGVLGLETAQALLRHKAGLAVQLLTSLPAEQLSPSHTVSIMWAAAALKLEVPEAWLAHALPLVQQALGSLAQGEGEGDAPQCPALPAGGVDAQMLLCAVATLEQVNNAALALQVSGAPSHHHTLLTRWLDSQAEAGGAAAPMESPVAAAQKAAAAGSEQVLKQQDAGKPHEAKDEAPSSLVNGGAAAGSWDLAPWMVASMPLRDMAANLWCMARMGVEPSLEWLRHAATEVCAQLEGDSLLTVSHPPQTHPSKRAAKPAGPLAAPSSARAVKEAAEASGANAPLVMGDGSGLVDASDELAAGGVSAIRFAALNSELQVVRMCVDGLVRLGLRRDARLGAQVKEMVQRLQGTLGAVGGEQWAKQTCYEQLHQLGQLAEVLLGA